MFAPKIGTKADQADATDQTGVPGWSNRLGPVADLATSTPVWLVGHTDLTGGPQVQVELKNPSEFRLVKDFHVGQDLPTL
jgi:hypothetical protein